MQQHDHVPPGFAESKRPVLGADVPSLCDVIRNCARQHKEVACCRFERTVTVDGGATDPP